MLKEKKILVFIMLILYVIFFRIQVFSQDLLSDVPKDHWAYKEIQKLVEEGWIDSTDPIFSETKFFSGDAKITRYELAKILYKVFERIETKEKLLFGSPLKQNETLNESIKNQQLEKVKENIKKLSAELAPELQTIKNSLDNTEKGVSVLEEQFKQINMEQSNILKEFKKETALINRGIKSAQLTVQSLQTDKNRILISGSGNFSMSGSEYLKYDPGLGINSDTISNSGFGSSQSFSLNLSAIPKSTQNTDRTIKITTGFSFGKSLGFPYEYPSGSQQSFSLLYSAPRAKFMELAGGDTSVGWSFLSLNMMGMSYRGFKARGMFANSTVELVAAQMKKPVVSSQQYAEVLKALSVVKTFKGANTVRISYFENPQDEDSIFLSSSIINEENTKKPENISLLSAYTRYQLTKSSFMMAEFALSRFVQYSKPPAYYTDSGGKITYTFEEGTPTTTIKDSAYLLEVDYNKMGLTATTIYARQNPKFHNRYGGILSILSGVGGSSMSLGGLDIGSLLEGVQALASIINYPPKILKGLNLQLISAFAGEVKPANLSSLPSKVSSSISIPKQSLLDLDKRKNKLKIIIFYPQISYRPSMNTSFNFSLIGVNAGIDKEVIKGVEFDKGYCPFNCKLLYDDTKGLTYMTSGENPITDPLGNGGERKIYFHVTNVIQDAEGNLSIDGMVPDAEQYYAIDDNENGTIDDTERHYVQFTQTGDIKVCVDSKPSPICNNYQDFALNVPGNTEGAERSGDYIFYYEPTGDLYGKVMRVSDKVLVLKIGFFNPKFKITHKFSSKLNYEMEWSEQDIKMGEVSLLTKDISDTIVKALTTFAYLRSNSINQSLSYQLFRNITLNVYYNMSSTTYFPQKNGRQTGNSKDKSLSYGFSFGMDF